MICGLLLAGILFAAVPLTSPGAQDAASSLSLEQCVDFAMSQGTDSAILMKNLAVSTEQYKVAVSQSSFSLSGSLGDNVSYGYGDGTLLLDFPPSSAIAFKCRRVLQHPRRPRHLRNAEIPISRVKRLRHSIPGPHRTE